MLEIRHNGYDVEDAMLRADQGWRRSSRCDTNACVEAAATSIGVEVRDSADVGGPQLGFGPAGWRAFLAGVTRGGFAAPPAGRSAQRPAGHR
jgi:hypothetical protein